MATFDAEEFDWLTPFLEFSLPATTPAQEFDHFGSANSILSVDWISDFVVRITFKSVVAGIEDVSKYAIVPGTGGVGVSILSASKVSDTVVDLTVGLATSGITYTLSFTP